MEVQLKLFIAGLADSLSLHHTIPTLVNNPSARLLTAQIWGVNGVLILGSVLLFNLGILPVVEVVGEAAFDIFDKNHYSSLLWLIYQSLWLVPICGLCYACSSSWYQSLADSITKKAKAGKSGSNKALKSVEYTIYSTISWAFVFLQVQLLTIYIPNSFAGVEFIVNKVFSGNDLANPMTGLLSSFLHQALLHISFLCRYFSTLLGLILMSALYSWYAFDPKWIGDDVSPDERFAILEKHLAYFLGFGLPYVMLNKLTSFFVGFGGFLMVFPLAIILGSVTDYSAPYRDLDVKNTYKLRIFKPAQIWTLQALKLLGQKAVGKRKAEVGSSREVPKQAVDTSVAVEASKDASAKKKD